MLSNSAATEAFLRTYLDSVAGEKHFDGADVSPQNLLLLSTALPGLTRTAQGGIDLKGKSLAGVSLRSANLSGADLRGANMEGVRAGGVRLQGALLEGAQLMGADLVGADLGSASAGEADFSDAMLEDAQMSASQLRFAIFRGTTLDGANLADSDLWGACMEDATAANANLRKARMDESNLQGIHLQGAELSRVSFRRSNMKRANLRNADLRGAVLDGANLAGANLTGASLPNLSLVGCDLDGAFFAGAWLERTRMRAAQLGGTVGEERGGQFAAAIDSYLVLEQNFTSLGSSDDARWAYLRRRRVGKQLHRTTFETHLHGGERWAAVKPGFLLLSDTLAEWLCDYGESLLRVARAFLVILIGFAVVYWLTGSLRARDGIAASHLWTPMNYLLFSLDSMTTVGTSEVALRPRGELGVLLSSIQTVVGTVLLGLFGFVLGARIRN